MSKHLIKQTNKLALRRAKYAEDKRGKDARPSVKRPGSMNGKKQA